MIIIIFKYFINGIINLPIILLSIIKYFFIGLIITITIIPRYFIIGIISIFDKNKTYEIKINNKPLIPIMMASLSLFIYFLSIFLFSRWYVQSLKLKYLTNDIISSTQIIEKIENNKENTDTEINDNNNNDNDNDEISNSEIYYSNDYWDYINIPYIDVNFTSLLQKNNDTVAWLRVEGTNVNYPVVQTTNNSYYLSHDYNKNANAGGWVFGDYRSNFNDFEKNTIIYGHNLNNKTMFGSIPDSVLNNNWQKNENNHIIKMSTPTSNTIWKIFSIYTIEPETYYLKTAFSTESFQEYINITKNRSLYNFNTDITTNDKILTLSTCDNTGTKRVVVHAKLVKIEKK